jgi:hypothetical protein
MKFILFIFTDTYFMCCIVMNTSVELLHVASEFNLAGPPPPPPETISISEQPSANPDTFCEVGKYIRVRIQINIHRSNLSCLYLLIHIFFLIVMNNPVASLGFASDLGCHRYSQTLAPQDHSRESLQKKKRKECTLGANENKH